MFTTTRLSNQSIGDLQTRLEANATGLVAGNTYYYRIKGANSASDWADATGTFVAESAISQSAGTLTFDTDGPTPRWSSSDGRSGTGQIITTTYLDSQSNSISYKTAKFDFNSLTIGDGVKVHLLGSNPLHLQVSGNATISATLILMVPMPALEHLILWKFSKQLVGLEAEAAEKLSKPSTWVHQEMDLLTFPTQINLIQEENRTPVVMTTGQVAW